MKTSTTLGNLSTLEILSFEAFLGTLWSTGWALKNGPPIVQEKVLFSKLTTLYGISSHQTNLFQVNFGGGLHSKSEGKVQK